MKFVSIDKLMEKRVTRKEFLGYVGVMFLTVIGFYSLMHSISNITEKGNNSSHNNNSQLGVNNTGAKRSGAYGNNTYGG